METFERKDDATPALEEPVKSEMILGEPDCSDRSNAAASPPPNCSICLGKLINTSFTDNCLHQFCFTCLLQWSKIKTECPLCKQNFKSIIHNVRSEEDYDQYNVQMTTVAAALEVTAERMVEAGTRFMYRTTLGSHRRYGIMNPEAVSRHGQIPSIIGPPISLDERRRRIQDPLEFRRFVYRAGRLADPQSLCDAFGRYRECSPEYFRRNPAAVDRLVPWLNRELQVLLNDAPHMAYSMNVILEAVTLHNIRGTQFRDIITPYFGVHTSHFVHEFYNFARTNLDMIGYDRSVVYPPPNGLSHIPQYQRVLSPISSSSSSSSDSDIRILDDSPSSRRTTAYPYSMMMPSMSSRLVNVPGPSSMRHVLQLDLSLPPAPPNVFTISSTSSESENECEVVGYVKPRHERTPEIIDLESDEAEVVTHDPPQTSTSQTDLAAAPADDVPTAEPESLPGPSHDLNPLGRQSRSKAEVAKAQIFEILNTSTSDDSDYSYTIKLKSSRSKKTTKTSSSRKARGRKQKTSIRLRKVAVRNSSPSDEENDSKKEDRTKKPKAKRKYRSKKQDKEVGKSKKVTTSKRKCSDSYSKQNRRSKRFKNNTSHSSSSSSSESSNHEKKSRKYRNAKVVVWQRGTSDSDEENESLSKRLSQHDSAQRRAKSPELFVSYSNSRNTCAEKPHQTSDMEKSESSAADSSCESGHSSSKNSSNSSCSSSRDNHRPHRKHKTSNRKRSHS